MQIFFTSVVIKPWQTFCDFHHKYPIQKGSMDPSSFEVWNKNIFSFVDNKFFIHSRKMKVSTHTGA